MGVVINGKTAEDIKARQEACVTHASCKVRPYESDETCDVFEVLENARALIEHLESERDAVLAKVPKWISVEERLPEPYQCVIVHARHTEKWRNNAKPEEQWHVVEEDCWLGDGWECNADTDIHEVTHWMPRPEPPKEEEK